MPNKIPPSFILVIQPEEHNYFPTTMWGTEWDEVFTGRLEKLTARFDLIISSNQHSRHNIKLPDTCNSAIICDCASFLSQQRNAPSNAVIFSPSALSLLEVFRNERRTLISNRSLRQGEVLSNDVLSEQVGGDGLSSDFRKTLIGHRVAHDINENASIDFGSIL